MLILLCIYHVFGMTDLISSVTAKFYIGYSLVGFLVFHFTFGISFVSVTTVRDGYSKLYKWYKGEPEKVIIPKDMKPMTSAENNELSE